MKFIKRKSALKPITGSIVDTFNINDKTTNAPSLRLMIDLLYPVGRGFIDFTDTDYSNWLGFTWERELVGMTPIGKNENDADFATVGAKGGEKEHTLTEAEIPMLSGTILLHSNNTATNIAGVNGKFTGPAIDGKYRDGGTLNTLSGVQSMNSIHWGIGGGQAHNNLPPYQVVSYWKRVDPNAVKLISFTIDGTSYQAEDGMTWYDWCNSNYNTSTWVCTSSTQTRIPPEGGNGEDYLALESGYKTTACVASDVIIANHAYGTGSSSK